MLLPTVRTNSKGDWVWNSNIFFASSYCSRSPEPQSPRTTYRSGFFSVSEAKREDGLMTALAPKAASENKACRRVNRNREFFSIESLPGLDHAIAIQLLGLGTAKTIQE